MEGFRVTVTRSDDVCVLRIKLFTLPITHHPPPSPNPTQPHLQLNGLPWSFEHGKTVPRLIGDRVQVDVQMYKVMACLSMSSKSVLIQRFWECFFMSSNSILIRGFRRLRICACCVTFAHLTGLYRCSFRK